MTTNVSDLVDILLGKQDFLQDFYKEIEDRKYKIYGFTPKEWMARVSLDIPGDCNLEQLKDIQAIMQKIIDEVGFFLAHSELVYNSIKIGSDERLEGAFAILAGQYRDRDKRLPAEATLRSIVASENKDLTLTLAAAETKRAFIAALDRKLAKNLKILENRGFILMAELKAATQGNLSE